ncbi:MAG: zf-HC2 domain-containing protein [Chloroflexota bacterium]|nr:zf-HC2 domain-containing protein [Chloroflexota bacterium]
MRNDQARGGGGDAERSRSPARPAANAARHLDLDTLTAYLDHELSDADSQDAEHHLRLCADCRQERDELRATVLLLRGLPQYAPRRSFRVGSERAMTPVNGGWLARLLPALPAIRVAMVAVAVLLLVVVTGDLLTGVGDDQRLAAPPPAPPNAEITDEQAEPAADDDAALQRDQAAPAANGTNSLVESSERTAVPPAPAAGRQPATNAAAARSTPMPAGDEAIDAAGDAGVEPAEAADGPSIWRLAQLALGFLLLWLMVTMVGLERLRRKP